MPLPSFFRSRETARNWNVVHAAAYGAGIGALAALFKTLDPLHSTGAAVSFVDSAAQIIGAAAVFALLCAGAAVLRNVLARRLIWHDGK